MTRTYCADVLQWAKEYDGEPFHALLCDPPYHLTSIVKRFGKASLADNTQTSEDARQRSTPYARGSVGFMGQEWDGGDIAFQPETWCALAHHLYAGGFGMAYGAARNYHRLAAAIEDAGLIIHPMIGWVYSSGFPKATKVKARETDEWITGFADHPDRIFAGHKYGLQTLKPALEPIVVFQKPYDEKPMDCILTTGAGTLNIDAGRIPSEPYTINTWDDNAHPFGHGAGNDFTGREENARYPANFIIGDERPDISKYFYNVQEQLDKGDPICFCKKANATEREAGLEEFELVGGKHNPHPTVKPIDLSRYLAALLLPPAIYAPRRLLVPFAGVHSEAIGALLAGWEDITAIEIDPKYCELGIARARYWKGKQSCG